MCNCVYTLEDTFSRVLSLCSLCGLSVLSVCCLCVLSVVSLCSLCGLSVVSLWSFCALSVVSLWSLCALSAASEPPPGATLPVPLPKQPLVFPSAAASAELPRFES